MVALLEFFVRYLGFCLGRAPDVFLRHELFRDHGIVLFVPLAHRLLQFDLSEKFGGHIPRGVIMQAGTEHAERRGRERTKPKPRGGTIIFHFPRY